MRKLQASGRTLVILAIVYGLTAKGYVESLDTVFSVATAESIVSHGRLDIPERRDGYTLTGIDGQSYSKFGIGLAFYFTPFVAAGHAIAALAGGGEPVVTGFLISFAQIPLALLLLALFARCLQHFGVPPAAVVWSTVALGLGTLCWHYATCDLSEAMQAALLFGVYYGVIQRERSSAAWAGAAFVLLILVKLVHVVLLPLFLLYLLLPDGDLREEQVARSALFLAPVLLIGLCIAWLNLHRFGSPFESGYGSEAHLFIPGQLWHTLPALLFSPDKGSPPLCPGAGGGAAGFACVLPPLPSGSGAEPGHRRGGVPGGGRLALMGRGMELGSAVAGAGDRARLPPRGLRPARRRPLPPAPGADRSGRALDPRPDPGNPGQRSGDSPDQAGAAQGRGTSVRGVRAGDGLAARGPQGGGRGRALSGVRLRRGR